MSTDNPNYFVALAGVDCGRHVERKGRFSYLSWPFAVTELLRRHPDATWRVHETPDGVPYVQSPAGAFVKVSVTVAGIERAQIHPILDANNRTVADPDAFQVNTSIQRAVVKAIALHGLGLYIYAGEDLPNGEPRSNGRSGQTIAAANEHGDWALRIAACPTLADLQRLWTAGTATGDLDERLRTVFTDRAAALRGPADGAPAGGGDAAA
jgi:hypothetical protein